MALIIKPKFTLEGIKRVIHEKLDKIEQAIIMRLQFVGETFVKNARENANFTDRTGNLRSSIGYVILKNGERIASDIKPGKGGETSETVLGKVVPNFPKGFVLIVVAGMEYAAAVESKNFDVLTGSSLIAEDELRTAIKEMSKKIRKMK